MREKLIIFGRAVAACSVLCIQSPSALLFLSVRYVQSPSACFFSFSQVCSVTTHAAFFFQSGMFSHHLRCFFLSVRYVQSPPVLLFSFGQVHLVTICTTFFFQSGMFSHHLHCFFFQDTEKLRREALQRKLQQEEAKKQDKKKKKKLAFWCFSVFLSSWWWYTYNVLDLCIRDISTWHPFTVLIVSELIVMCSLLKQKQNVMPLKPLSSNSQTVQ